MKQKLLNSFKLKATFLVALLCAVCTGAWATSTTYSFSSIPTTGWSTKGGTNTIDEIEWTYSSSTYIGGANSRIQIGSKNSPQTSAWTIQTPISSFGSGKAVKEVSITAYTTATSATYDISVGGASVKSGSLTTSSATYTATGLNVTSGSIVVTLTGSSTSKAMYLEDISVTYDDASTDPVISASDVELAYNATAGEFNYSISNPVDDASIVPSITAGNAWLSNAAVVDNKVTFVTTVNEDEDNARVGTIHLVYGDDLATKDVTVTQAKAPKKYTVTIETPTGGTLVVKNGDVEVTTGTRVAVGTELTIVPTADATHKYTSWQFKKGEGSWTTKTTNFTYTVDDNDVTFKANFAATYPVNWSVNGTVTSTTRFMEDETITFPDAPADIDGRTFVGWVDETITGTTDDEPEFLTAPVMGTSELTYYAVFADAEGSGETAETKTQTLQYDTWTYSGTTTDKSSYRLFGSGSYIESTSFDLSKLSKVIVYGGTFGGGSFKNLTIGDGTNTWKNVEVSGSSQTGTNTYTEGTALSGTKKLRITSNSGNGSTTGVRISKIEIFTMEQDLTYSGYCTTVATLIVGNTTATTVVNDQDGWTAAYTYSSDNTDVATVAADGVITAVAKGTANITVTLNVDKSDPDYKKGETFSKSIEITVNNPSHTVTFMANGVEVSSESVEEGEAITVPDNPAAEGAFSFIGWTTATVATPQNAAPELATITTMGDADVTYNAVYAVEVQQEVTATFDASNISNLTSTGTRKWQDNTTGITLDISAGQHYTGGDPKTWTVTASSSSDNCMTIYRTGCNIKKVVVTVSEETYAVGDYYAYEKTDSETGTDLTSVVSTDGTVSTWTLDGDYEMVALWSTSKQIRATKVEVDAVIPSTGYYCTAIPTYSVTVGATGYATFSSDIPLNFTDSDVKAYIAKADGRTGVTFEQVKKVPANTGVLLYSASGATTEVIPVLAGATDDTEGNVFVAVLETIDELASTVGEGETAKHNYILNNVGGVIGFYQAAGKKVAAGKAYIQIDYATVAAAGGDVKGFIALPGFEDETAVNEIVNGQSINGKWHNLAGQRVNKAQKGIFIVNGKKVVK